MTRIYKRKSEAKPADAQSEEYKPTQGDIDLVVRHKASREKLGPRLKVTDDGANTVRLDVHHPNSLVGALAIMQKIGTESFDFYDGLMGQLVNASKEKAPSEAGANFMLAVIKGIEPHDQMEAMLAAQMAAVHMASMTFARRLAHVDNIQQQDSASNAFNKLTRTYAAQMAALKAYRSKGEQKMTVQHVHVAEGGQAIVGSINPPPEGGGVTEKTGEQPHALGYAPGVTLSGDLEAERAAMPSASRERS